MRCAYCTLHDCSISRLMRHRILRNLCRRIPMNFNLHMPPRGCVSIGIYAAGGGLVQIVFAAVLANIGGNIADDGHCVIALQRDCGSAGMGLSGLADRALHYDDYPTEKMLRIADTNSSACCTAHSARSSSIRSPL